MNTILGYSHSKTVVKQFDKYQQTMHAAWHHDHLPLTAIGQGYVDLHVYCWPSV